MKKGGSSAGTHPVRRTLGVLFKLVVSCVLVVILGTLGANLWVLSKTRARVLSDVSRVVPRAVGLVLGTSPTAGSRRATNPFFEGRMNAAARLYKAGKVRHLLLSGDNRRSDYDEPAAMRASLLRRGVPPEALILDRAGIRTLDSIARAKAIFGLSKVMLITDDFHQPRALFLADAFGVDAVGFASEHVPWKISFKTRVREWGSRVKACLDIYVLHTQARFYGPPIPIGEPAKK